MSTTDRREYGPAASTVSSLSDGNVSRGDRDYVISPPTTSGDDGSPSDSLSKDVKRVLALIQDERHLVAHDLYCNVRTRIHQGPAKVASPKRKGLHWNNSKARKQHNAAIEAVQEAYRLAKELFDSKQAEFEKLETVARLFRKAKEELTEQGDWIFSQTSFGVATYYRREDDGSLSIKLEGSLNGVPLFEQVAVLREVDLHYKWVPFCTSSIGIKQLDKIDVVGWFVTGLPNFGLMRDGCFRAIGCDSIWEDGNIILVGQGVADRHVGEDTRDADDRYLSEDPAIAELDIPPVPTRLGAGRMTIQKFHAVIEILSPSSAKTKIVANINPNLDFVPQSLIDFLMKKLCGVVISKLQNGAAKCAKEPVKNAHARRMRQEADFYDGWLRPKFQDYCNAKGWKMSSVRALELTEEEELSSRRYEETKYRKSRSSPPEFELNDNTGGNNSVAHSAPVFPTMDDDSEMSDISGTSSVWRNNPIAAHLRELERKAQLRKAEEIAKSRKRAADRLKRSKLSKEEKKRLKELKKVKARRRSRQGPSATSERVLNGETEAMVGKKLSSWTENLYSHGPYTRFAVVACLATVMMALFQAKGVSWLVGKYSDTWKSCLLQDIGTLAYLLLCASVHFLLCDVSFVYAFESLDLGMKTGRRTKLYYSGAIHLLGAATSLGIVAGSTVKAVLAAVLREVYWYSLQMNNSVREIVDPLFGSNYTDAVGEITPATNFFFPFVAKMAGYMSNIFFFVVSLSTSVSGAFLGFLNYLTVRSHWVGRTTQDLMYWGMNRLFPFTDMWNEFTRNAIGSHEGTIELTSWRSNAVETSKFLLMHTAVFIVSILFLFNVSTSKRKKSFERSDDLSSRNETSSELSAAPTSPASIIEVETRSTETPTPVARHLRVVNKFGPTPPNSGGSDLRHTVIHEGEEEDGFEEAESSVVYNMPNHVMTPSLASGSTAKRRRGLKKFRLRRRKKSGDESSSDTSSSALRKVASDGTERGSYPDLQQTNTF